MYSWYIYKKNINITLCWRLKRIKKTFFLTTKTRQYYLTLTFKHIKKDFFLAGFLIYLMGKKRQGAFVDGKKRTKEFFLRHFSVAKVFFLMFAYLMFFGHQNTHYWHALPITKVDIVVAFLFKFISTHTQFMWITPWYALKNSF